MTSKITTSRMLSNRGVLLPLRFKVVSEQEYLVMPDESINGWSSEKIAEDWFKNSGDGLNSDHATRDSHRLGAIKILRIEANGVEVPLQADPDNRPKKASQTVKEVGI